MESRRQKHRKVPAAEEAGAAEDAAWAAAMPAPAKANGFFYQNSPCVEQPASKLLKTATALN